MENKISKQICNYMLHTGIIDGELLDVYIYGMELLISFIFSTVIILCIGFISNTLILTLIYLFIFIGIRRYTGGYHANSYIMCKIITIGTYITVLCLSRYTSIDIIQYFICTLVGIPIIIMWGPIENPNKPLTNYEKKRSRLIALISYIITMFIGLLVYTYYETLGNVICYTLMSIITLMIISKFKKGVTKNEETLD